MPGKIFPTDDLGVNQPKNVVQQEVRESSTVSHYLEETDVSCTALVVQYLHGVVDLVYELEEIEDLPVLSHGVGNAGTEQLIFPGGTKESGKRNLLELFLNLRNVGVDVASVDKLGYVLDDTTDLVSTLAGTEHHLCVLGLVHYHLASSYDLDAALPQVCYGGTPRYEVYFFCGGVGSHSYY